MFVASLEVIELESTALPTTIQTEEGVMPSFVCRQSPFEIMQEQYLVDGGGELG